MTKREVLKSKVPTTGLPYSQAIRVGDLVFVAGQVALTVLGSVVSRQRGDTAVVDAGWKALSTDSGMPVVKGRPELEYTPKGDEHGGVRGARMTPGDRVELIPSHCDTTVNLYNEFVCVRRGVLEAVWPIAARGRIQ